MKKVIYTLGTSTRRLKDFTGILQHYGIEQVIDVRHFPTSSRFPHFKKERLTKSLPKKGVDYLWLGEKLGGYRPEGYESYSHSPDFEEGLRELELAASKKLTAFFCAEKIFFRCHRRYIADALIKRGWEVWHIVEKGREIKGKMRPKHRKSPRFRGL